MYIRLNRPDEVSYNYGRVCPAGHLPESSKTFGKVAHSNLLGADQTATASRAAGRHLSLQPLHRIGSDEGAEVWTALDALVLKAMAIVLTRRLKPHLSQHCYHLAGHGGSKAAVRAVAGTPAMSNQF